MPVIWRGDANCVDVVATGDLAEVLIRVAVTCTTLFRVGLLNSMTGVLTTCFVDVGDRHDLDIRGLKQTGEVIVTCHFSATDDTEFHGGMDNVWEVGGEGFFMGEADEMGAGEGEEG